MKLPSRPFSSNICVQAMRKIEAYVANIKACDRLICDFVSSLLTQIFTPVQMARCIVATYPYWPDMLALSTYIAASEGTSCF